MNGIKGIIEDVEKSDLVSDKVIKKIIEIIGQEKWQDINDSKSDICTTTGELIITLKGIPELEKENAELKEQISTKDILIKELQEQKAYWKESSFDWRHKFFKKGSTKRLVQKSKQLSKAKEHIQTLISCLIDWVQEGDKDYCYIEDAEQFIKDLEK